MSRLWADLSNNDPDFDPVKYRKAGHRLLGLKVTEGKAFHDATHATNAKKAHDHKIAVAHYHFAQPDQSTPIQQASWFWKNTHYHFRQGDYVVLDLEVMHSKGQTATITWAEAFCKRLLAISGHRAVLYSGQAFLMDLGPEILKASERIWMAQYAARPVKPGFMTMRKIRLWAWQRTGDGIGPKPHTLPGCPPNCDVNVLNTRSYLHLVRSQGLFRRA